ncbi:MAG: CHAT domain-containing protein, partial [Emticicia sp.]|uniref:CHAT domain-containing protein n=1 Tax=Emticicia sp. TaxID=1930953 RepID=UPI003BA4D80C
MILLPNLALANLFDYDRKDYKTASSILDESINIIKNKYRHVKSPQISRLYSNASIIYINNKEFKKAETCTFDALKAFPNATKSIHDINLKVLRRISDKWTFYDLLRSYSSWYLLEKYKITKEKKYLKEALTVFEKLDLLIDLMRAEHLGFENLSKFHWRERTHRLFESAIETCFLLKDYQKAFYFFEKSRAVMLNDKINELGAKQTLSEDDQQQERKYIKDISELNANIEKEQNQKKKSDLTTQLYTLQEQQDRFIKTLETKNPAYYQLKYDTTTFQLNDIQSYLKKTQINSLVEYFMGDSTTYAIVVTPENVTLKKLSLKPENIQQFLEYCSKNISTKTELSALLGYGSSLYQSLIAPLNLPNGRLIISQDGAFIPFEAISKSSNSPQYLLKDYAISYTYSVQFLMKNQEKYGFLPNKIFLGAAPINFSSKLNTLQGSEQSLKNIEKNYTFGNLLTNQVASRNAFLNEAGKYKIVQLYTHAFADSNDTEPKIYFADSALKVSDLNLTDHFKTNLLVLSACKTGVGKVAKGEGVLSLARGFSMAGIRSTITSLWSVEDKDTYTLTELFHHYLNEGLPKDEALQQAKLEFIERNENTTPYSWAGFILIGDSSEISTS